ncbi:DUF1104 domain-containing protein [Helicobacter cynogastricus]|uniref:DUF1104 domain-containing protein n=1 Tax=Helicobacter cynogastricus TaxID=329937 RepID=UPI001315714F|nr:DUF1104 domain-containing protein [Helicobacter cynogastricus]
MRRFLGLVMMGALALGVAHAEDYSHLNTKEFVKLAGTLHNAEDVLDYQMEVAKRLKTLKGKARANFKMKLDRTYRTNLAKMSAKDFVALRKEVASALEEKKKDHSHDELVGMGLDVQVCKTKKRELLCAHKHTKKHGSKHHGHGNKHGHGGMKHESKGEAKQPAPKAEEQKPEASKPAPAKTEEHKEVKQEGGEHHE